MSSRREYLTSACVWALFFFCLFTNPYPAPWRYLLLTLVGAAIALLWWELMLLNHQREVARVQLEDSYIVDIRSVSWPHQVVTLRYRLRLRHYASTGRWR